jgi:glycosyltransferase involved in cell wall biosynthesis
MDEKLRVCLLNDSFPPMLDGVANATVNYARVIQNKLGRAIVATPSYPDVTDDYSFPVVRYPSLDVSKSTGYRAGLPFSPTTLKELAGFEPDIIHSHCPMASNVLARALRVNLHVPIVMTYHTKFDIDIAKAIKSELMQTAAISLVVKNIKACDEIWVVSRGSGENLKSLGYRGDYILMDNGVDFPRGKAAPEEVAAVCHRHELDERVPVFLFVGRMVWYKGIRFTLDGLRILRSQGLAFKMIFIGDGGDFEEIKNYAQKLGLSDACIFTGAIRDRSLLRAYYSLADLFLLPSTFDNRPIVMLEAAACGLASLLIRGSSSAETVTDGRQALLVEENAESLAEGVARVIKDRTLAAKMGRYAMDELYISWEDAVAKAFQRYFIVIDNYQRKIAEKRAKARSFFVR